MKRIVFLFLVFFFSGSAHLYASYAVIDSHTGRIFYASNPHEKMPIASLTKIWTALVVIENAELNEKVTVSQRAALSEGSSVYLKAGEQYTVEELLYGLMLRSGNDAAMALAEHVGGSEEGFVYLMNARAKVAGLQNTTFTNASGLHNPLHLSTAYDTARMLQVALENEVFSKVASARVFNSSFGQFVNKHKLVTNGDAVAGKTGYTKVAGRTLATYFEKNKKTFVVVTLNEPNDWVFHQQLARMVDERYEYKTIIRKGTYTTETYAVKISKDLRYLVSKEEEKELQHLLLIPTTTIRPVGVWQIRFKSQVIDSFHVELRER